ncbi:aminotransferase class I/II-fold pyridoxal phosphate-dependent enzyme [Nitratireductor sp. StC3]|uniref:aminotransferase class I/II-fold pyridoxal phosphate-dependent enzyme n=1 Tax=Nitratireductor sp. StC3 TaxID=2126741 RepID=UPI0018EC630E|nr:aminotransferase class I/II-fold pyridoxal phosphate-dependent enzyme [Nitratireductor sp. StC3]
MRRIAVAHLGGTGDEQAAVINRTSAGNVAAILALSNDRPVVSLVPAGDRSHASVIRGARLAGVALHEVHDLAGVERALTETGAALLVVTTVTSELSVLPDDLTRAAIAAARTAKAISFMDEAYGARFRPVLCGGAKSLRLGADLVITNADKAGLSGPRAGVLCGRPDMIVPVVARASELGMEARAPISVGAMRSLQAFAPELLVQEAQDGQDLATVLEEKLGGGIVARSALGPKLDENDLHAKVLELAGQTRTARVPAETTAAIGMLMLRDLGIVTVNTHGQPGGRVSMRLKPTSGALARAGGAERIADGLTGAMGTVAEHLEDRAWFANLLFGGDI